MLEFLATACSGIFAGAAVYISIGQQPAAHQVGVSTAAALFPPMYRRAAPMQAGLALVGSLSGLGAFLAGDGIGWLLGAVLLGSVVPFTLLVIKPVNDQLLSPDLDPSSAVIPGLLERWSRLHWVRTWSSVLSFLVFLVA